MMTSTNDRAVSTLFRYARKFAGQATEEEEQAAVKIIEGLIETVRGAIVEKFSEPPSDEDAFRAWVRTVHHTVEGGISTRLENELTKKHGVCVSRLSAYVSFN